MIAYGASRSVTEGLLGARGLLLASVLGPELFGGWALFRLATHYGGFAGLGVHQGLEREGVRAGAGASAGSDPSSDVLARTTLGFDLLVFGVMSVAALGASFLVSDPGWVTGLRGFAAAIVAYRVYLYALVQLRTRGELRRYASVEVAQAAFQLGFTVLLALQWGLAGAFAGFTLASLAGAALLLRHVPSRPTLALGPLRHLLRVGFPISLALIASMALGTADRFVVLSFGGTGLLGYYAFAVSVAGLATTLVPVVRTVIFPEVYGDVERSGVERALRSHFRKTVLPFSLLYPPLLGALALLIGPAVMLLLPQYAPAIAPARIFIFMGALGGLSSFTSLGIVAADRQRWLPLFASLALLLNVGLSILAFLVGGGLEGAAAGAFLGRATYAAAIIGLAASVGGIGPPLQLVLKSIFPVAYCAVAVFVLGRVFPGAGVESAMFSLGAYVLLLLPIPLLARTGVLRFAQP